jgi:hypothetical protein
MELFESDDRFRTRTQYTPVSLRYFHPSGFVGQVDATYVDQSANGQSGNRLGEDEFLLINAESVTGYQSATGSYGSVLETSSTRSSAIEISTIAQHNSVPPPRDSCQNGPSMGSAPFHFKGILLCEETGFCIKANWWLGLADHGRHRGAVGRSTNLRKNEEDLCRTNRT